MGDAMRMSAEPDAARRSEAKHAVSSMTRAWQRCNPMVASEEGTAAPAVTHFLVNSPSLTKTLGHQNAFPVIFIILI